MMQTSHPNRPGSNNARLQHPTHGTPLSTKHHHTSNKFSNQSMANNKITTIGSQGAQTGSNQPGGLQGTNSNSYKAKINKKISADITQSSISNN